MSLKRKRIVFPDSHVLGRKGQQNLRETPVASTSLRLLGVSSLFFESLLSLFAHEIHTQETTTMAKKGGENSKKAAGNARKAEQANKKKAEEDARREASEAAEWEDGSKKGNKKKEEAAAKKAEAARKKAERDAALKEEEEALPSKASAKGRGAAKVAAKRAGKIDDFLNDLPTSSEISASGLDNALEALTLTKKSGAVSDKDIDRHPERRFKAALAAYEERRVPEMRKENPGLRLQQVKQLVFKEFEKSPENPFNQVTNVSYDATKQDVQDLKQNVKKQREAKYVK